MAFPSTPCTLLLFLGVLLDSAPEWSEGLASRPNPGGSLTGLPVEKMSSIVLTKCSGDISSYPIPDALAATAHANYFLASSSPSSDPLYLDTEARRGFASPRTSGVTGSG